MTSGTLLEIDLVLSIRIADVHLELMDVKVYLYHCGLLFIEGIDPEGPRWPCRNDCAMLQCNELQLITLFFLTENV